MLNETKCALASWISNERGSKARLRRADCLLRAAFVPILNKIWEGSYEYVCAARGHGGMHSVCSGPCN